MRILGISPLDKDATVSLVEDGEVLYAAAEERFSRQKLHSGFPQQSLEAAFRLTRTTPEMIDVVAYAFLPWDQEEESLRRSFQTEWRMPAPAAATRGLQRQLRDAEGRVPARNGVIPGLRHPNQTLPKSSLKRFFYRLAGGSPAISRRVASWAERRYLADLRLNHRQWQEELHRGLEKYGLPGKLRCYEHHLSHAANAYLASGFERALIVTIDGYGTGLAGSVSLGEGGSIRRLHNIRFPNSLGVFYESVTSSLGFRADRHAGKIVGLAAYGDSDVLSPVLLSKVDQPPGDFRLLENLNIYFSRHLATRFPMIDVAAAYQHVLEGIAGELVRHWALETGCDSVVLSGGVAANVKMNQRIHEVTGIERTFIYPNMGDGGCGTGLGLYLTWPGGVREAIHDVYWGPCFTSTELRSALEEAGLPHYEPGDLAGEVAARIHAGEVIARFDGRMEYGPRALGNRSILYHARDPHVNQWLNQRLGRTEFMPFAPVTLWEARHRCYQNLAGAEHAAEFMTITFACTAWMRQNCPAAVHVDGTARPQLIRREVNPVYYDILREYQKLSGLPCLINTSFNMHEEPIVCTPRDAVRGFLAGNLDGLAMGPFFAPNPRSHRAPQLRLAVASR